MHSKGPTQQVRYRSPDRSKRKEYDADFQAVMIGDLRRRGELLEIGCKTCGRHGFYDVSTMRPRLRDNVPVYLAAMFLVCSNCGARNADDAKPAIWARAVGNKAKAQPVVSPGRMPRTK
jgi:hypothetical protein